MTAAITTAAIVAAGAAPAFAPAHSRSFDSGLPATETKSTNGGPTTIPEAEKQVAEATAAADAACAAKETAKSEFDAAKEAADKAMLRKIQLTLTRKVL